MPQPSGNDVSPNQEGFSPISPPSLSLPKGGGAIRGIGEKFAANPVTGTTTLSVPMATSSGRAGFGPQLALYYDSGAGNGPFGFGWHLRVPEISRKTDKGLPRYDDASDVFLLSDAEDLVAAGEASERGGYRIQCFRPRVEGLFARIERWTHLETGQTHWRSISRENTTTTYGASAASRIADPDDPARIFRWLITETHDDRGNVMVYEYKPEDAAGVNTALPHEANRERSANRYLKRILYGNRRPHPAETEQEWLFEVVFDYGEHDPDNPTPGETGAWPLRPDAFSSYRAGFEIRTSRLCRRVLMFHHFPEEEGVGRDCVVWSTDYAYRENGVASFITSVTRTGWKRRRSGGYLRRSLPPVEFGYSKAELREEVREIDRASLENLPYGLHDSDYRWVDLDGEGLSGILSEQGGAWLYKRNLGGGRLGPAEEVSPEPSLAALGGGGQQFLDLAGDGRLDLVLLGGPVAGFYERTEEAQWESFRAFRSLPNLRWDDPNLRFLDMDGDGHADILLTEDDAITWFPSLAEDGFGQAQRVPHTARLIFADAEESVYAADMSGDGLMDLVRIRHSEICYFPNLGRGRFGAKVTMTNSPWLDAPGRFDQSRVRLADIDGSGTTDLIYLGAGGVRVYFNQSGNGWSEARPLRAFPPVDSVSSVAAVDLLGNGTACLVWSSALPGEGSRPLRYIDLMGGVKPHLLTSIKNNLGAETHVDYAPSTRFYLEDREAGRPWRTRLPFPVHVVERVETRDRISHNRFVTRYRYHDGFYDGVEREFRGFGMVEQEDTEAFAALARDESSNLDAATHVPPVLTKTWFHTGAPQTGGEHELPDGMTPEETREAWRALKGSVLRKEVYALDGSPLQANPYTVSERTYRVRMLQPQGKNPYAVFLVYPRETVESHNERNPTDPRVMQSLSVEVDDFGNVLKAAAVAHGRRHPDPSLAPEDAAEQTRTLMTWTENKFTNPVSEDDHWRLPLPCEQRTYEIRAGSWPGRLKHFDWVQPADRKLIGSVRTYYRPDDLGASSDDRLSLLPLGRLAPLALPGQAYQLAFTREVLDTAFRRGEEYLLKDIGPGSGGYVDLDNDGNWWIPSGRVFYSDDPNHAASEELKTARHHFFTPRLHLDSFGQWATRLSYDSYDLLPIETRDALNNRTTIGERGSNGSPITNGNDYRVLQPRLIMDANRNRSAAAYDALGMVVGTAVQGKPEERAGDSLDGFDPDLPVESLTNPPETRLLQDATSCLVYDYFAFLRTQDEPDPQPCAVCLLTRETHAADLPEGEQSRVRREFIYSDGFGRVIQKKAQAEAASDNRKRWVGTGWTVFNNKGNPVRQYEPFFTDTFHFERAREKGVSSIVFYDPVERPVVTLYPNGTYHKVVFNPWRQATWDVNDTVSMDPRSDPDVAGFLGIYFAGHGWKTWHQQRLNEELRAAERDAATKTARHACTPTVSWFDALSRPFFSCSDDGRGQKVETRIRYDLQGNQREVRDALGRTVVRRQFSLPGSQVWQQSMDAGEHWTLNDVARKPIFAWNSGGFRLRQTHDVLHRPLDLFVQVGENELLVSSSSYGESQPDAEKRNLRNRSSGGRDQAGMTTNDSFDFKGNLLTTSRQLASNYRGMIDWQGEVALEQAVYTKRMSYDALNRPVTTTEPDGTVTRLTYNEANLLSGIDVNLRGEKEEDKPVWTPYLTEINYNAKEQRTEVEFGNGVRTSLEYDPLTFRLTKLRTVRQNGNEPLQDLRYTYDPIGNITNIGDDAQQPVFFRNQRVEAVSNYTYDALYRLTEASGREHLGAQSPPAAFDGARIASSHPNDGQALARYREWYDYDPAGNLLEIRHQGTDSSCPGWTRTYAYHEPSGIESDRASNRLTATSVGDTTDRYAYDGSAGTLGCMTRMLHLASMQWDYRNALASTTQQVVVDAHCRPETAWYRYDATGQRTRKVSDRETTDRAEPARKSERLYLGGLEIYREYESDGESVRLERQTVHIMDGQHRIALVEIRTQGEAPGPERQSRYQLGDHLGSCTLEIDERARIVSREEYYPFGSTSYSATPVDTEVPKRYRFSGKERDEENGFYYHGSRYYAPWLGRWTSCDPAGMVDGTNLYAFTRNNPIRYADPSGTQCDPTMQSCVDPTQLTPLEMLRQQCIPEEHPTETFTPQPEEPAPAPLPVWEEGPRGERFRINGYTGPPRANYTKPYAQIAAAQGKYEFAELAENYLCATCHVTARYGHMPSDDEFNMRVYVRTYQQNYKTGIILLGSAAFGAVAPGAAAVVGAWETGISTAETITGESSGLHLMNLLSGDSDMGRQMSTGERVFSGVNAGVGWFTMGMGVRADLRRPMGARGMASGRDFDPAMAGGPVRQLSTEGVRITPRGIDVVEAHLARFGADEANAAMVARLREIAAGRLQATSSDMNFYTHELREFVRYRQLGFRTGDPGYDVWNNAHTATLEDYGLAEGPGVLYHPSVTP